MVVAATSLLVSATGAHARGGGAKKSTAPAEVTATGCVKKGTQPYCWSFRTKEGLQYSFGGTPAVEDTCYDITGTPTLGLCKQGTQLGVTKLERSKVNCCDPAAPAAPTPAAAP